LLRIALQAGAQTAGLSTSELSARLPEARQEAVLLYADGRQGGSAPPVGAAVRSFPRFMATAVDDGASVGEAALFSFEAYLRWRLLQSVLYDGVDVKERRRRQQEFSERLGRELLEGPLKDARLPPHKSPANGERDALQLRSAFEGCDRLLKLMQQRGLLSRFKLQTTLGSGSDEYDEDDWLEGGSTGWQYVVSGSTLVGVSQLSQDKTAATGLGAGLFPGQLITAPLQAYLANMGVDARIDEYFLDNRVGRPDPRTFADPSYYSEVLLEVILPQAARPQWRATPPAPGGSS
jgi:hypothetical protein